MPKLLLIDEQNCFQDIQAVASQPLDVELLEAEYFVAPNPDFFNKMIDASQQADYVIIHRQIWIDECEKGEQCLRLDEFTSTVAPTPVLRVGNNQTSHESCPQELLKVYQQIRDAIHRLGEIIGAKVIPPNLCREAYLVIKSLEIIGDNMVGCTLQSPSSGDTRKYFLLSELQPYSQSDMATA